LKKLQQTEAQCSWGSGCMGPTLPVSAARELTAAEQEAAMNVEGCVFE
jgi:hypothetical protein